MGSSSASWVLSCCIKFYNSLNHVILDNISILSLENDGIIKPNIFEFNEFKKLGEGIEGE